MTPPLLRLKLYILDNIVYHISPCVTSCFFEHLLRCRIASFFFLSQATKTLPMGTAYGIWTGIGALGAVIVGILAFQEPVTVPRLIFVGLLLVGIVGLKLTA